MKRSQSETAEESIYEELDEVKNEVKDLENNVIPLWRPLSIIGSPEPIEDSVLKSEPKKDEFSDENPKVEELKVIDQDTAQVLEQVDDNPEVPERVDENSEVIEKVKKKKSKKKNKSDKDSESSEKKAKKKKKRAKNEAVEDVKETNPDPELEVKPESIVTEENQDVKKVIEEVKVKVPETPEVDVKTKIPEPSVTDSSTPEVEKSNDDSPEQVNQSKTYIPKIHSLSVEKILMDQKEPEIPKNSEPQTKLQEPNQEIKGKLEETEVQNVPMIEPKNLPKVEPETSKVEPKILPKVNLTKEIKGRSAETSRNPLARKPITKIDPSSLIKSDDNLPNFRMAPVSTSKIPGIQKTDKNSNFSRENSKIENSNFSRENSNIQDDDDINIDLRLFAKPTKKPTKPKLPQGLTAEEERVLEQAEKTKLEHEQKLKEAELEKSQKLNEARIQRKIEENARLAKTRELKIEKDLKAKAQKLSAQAPPKTTEDLRAQLKQMTANSIINRKVVDDLVIEEDDDLLPVRRNKTSTSTSSLTSDTSSSNEGLVKAEPLLPNQGMLYCMN